MPIQSVEIEKSGVYSAQAPIATLLADLGEIDALIAKTKRKRRQWKWFSLIVLVVGVGLTVVAPFMLVLGILAAIALFITSFFIGNKLIRNEDREMTLRTILNVLAEDSAPRSKFKVRLNVQNKEVKKSETPWPARKKGKESILEDDWLSLEGGLLDDTMLFLGVTDYIRERQFVNVSGKTKTKRKVRKYIDMKLTYRAELYGNTTPVRQGLKNSFQLPPGVTLRACQGSDTALSVKAVCESTGDLKEGLMALILGSYRILNLSRHVVQSAAGGSK